MPDLYAELGVPRHADRDAIKRAYRKKAKRAHPDGGGTKEKFGALALAFEILSDESRRKAYDETGKIDEKPVDNSHAEIMMMINAALDQVIGALDGRGVAFECVDLVTQAADVLSGRVAQLKEQAANLTRSVKKLRKIEKRFKAKPGKQDVLSGMMVGRIAHIERNLSQVDKQREQVEKAVAILRDHTFDVDRAVVDPFASAKIHPTMQNYLQQAMKDAWR